MQALQYEFNVPRYLLARGLGRHFPSLYYGPLSCLRLVERAEPRPPGEGEGWVALRTRLAGICGTDLATLAGKVSPALSPFSSFPAVPGHEILAVVEGPAGRDGVAHLADGLRPGQRVVVDPSLGCAARGLPLCPGCQEGLPYRCERTAEGSLPPGMILGFCRDLPGGWGERLVAPASQLHPVPDTIPDERAVLVEPLAVSLHGVLRRPPAADERVLVIGGGTVGLTTVAALRLLEPAADVSAAVRYSFQAELAGALGAHHLFRGAGSRPVEEAARKVARARAHRALLGPPTLTGGFDRVYDCVGSPQTLELALRVTRAGGSVTLLGGAWLAPRVDWTFVWAREVAVVGSAGYGTESYRGEKLHTFDLALRLLEAHPELPLERLVTHRFPLRAYQDALRVAFGHRTHRSVKVVFTFDGAAAPPRGSGGP